MNRIGAWIAASLAAIWVAMFLPVALTYGLGIIALPLALAVMIIVGIPLALLAKKLGWTGWSVSMAAGAFAGLVPAIGTLALTPDAGFAGAWVPLLLFSLPGALGGLAFRAVLGRYRIVGPAADADVAGYDYRPSPWPAATLLIVLSAAGLVAFWAMRF